MRHRFKVTCNQSELSGFRMPNAWKPRQPQMICNLSMKLWSLLYIYIYICIQFLYISLRAFSPPCESVKYERIISHRGLLRHSLYRYHWCSALRPSPNGTRIRPGWTIVRGNCLLDLSPSKLSFASYWHVNKARCDVLLQLPFSEQQSITRTMIKGGAFEVGRAVRASFSYLSPLFSHEYPEREMPFSFTGVFLEFPRVVCTFR